jgi:serine/threonine protein kinase
VWLAPEVSANKIYTVKADVYSIGVILWELLTRQNFFGNIRFMSILEDKVKAGERPPIPDDCIPAYRRLIEDCWAHDPDARPTCAAIAERVDAIMREVCPEASDYDAQVDRKYQSKREAEAEEKRKALATLSRTLSENRLARRTAPSTAAIVTSGSDSKRSLLSHCIKEVAQLDDCSKKDIVTFMEQFLKQRRNHLLAGATEGGEDGVSVGAQSVKKADERQWIETFLQQLEAERTRTHEDEVATLAPTQPHEAP